jgi:hypothetical protein
MIIDNGRRFCFPQVALAKGFQSRYYMAGAKAMPPYLKIQQPEIALK